jgi:shikimate kinase
VLLNGTPAGMWPHTGDMPVPPALLDHVEAVYDTIYNPLATRLVLTARQRGIPARGGLGMLVRQALVAQQIWHPEAVFPVTIVQDILAEMAQVVYQHSPMTLVLTGFMGSGKSRLGLELADRTGWPLVDLDQRIVETAGRSIPDIFATDGEAFFRSLECRHLAEVLQNPRCQILATGGGALLSDEAQAILYAQPVRIVYLDANLETVKRRVGDGHGRPMLSSGDSEAMARLLAMRRPIYEKLADLTIQADRPLLEKTNLIIDLLGLGGQSQ